MPTQAPKIDPRTYQDIVRRTEELARLYAGWQPHSDGRLDGGQALIRIFARMAELLIARLNQVPDKNFLAFLELISTQVLPPRPARVPLTFYLAAGGAGDALVPTRTQVAAAPIPDDPGPVLFETERDLVVTRSELVAVFTREPGTDRYGGSYAGIATGLAAGDFLAFAGDQPVAHRIYLSHPQFDDPQLKSITVAFAHPEVSFEGAVDDPFPWGHATAWSYWDGAAWRRVKSRASSSSSEVVILLGAPPDDRGPDVIRNIPAIPATTIAGIASRWLRGELIGALPTGEVLAPDIPNGPRRIRRKPPPDTGLSEYISALDGQSTIVELRLDRPFAPFRQLPPLLAGGQRIQTFYLACDEAFSKPGALIAIAVDLDPATPVGLDSQLLWEYSAGGDTWQELGQSSPSNDSMSETQLGFSDTTRAFTRSGTISFAIPAIESMLWQTQEVAGRRHFWLRAHVSELDAQQGYAPPPTVRGLTIGYEWALPRISGANIAIRIADNNLAPEAGLAGQLPLDLSKAFLPFGEKPKFNDTLVFASQAFARPFTRITLDIALDNPRISAPAAPAPPNARSRSLMDQPIPPVRPSPDLRIAWEYYNGREWQPLLYGTPFPGDTLLDAFENPTAATILTLTGQYPAGATVTVDQQFTGQSSATVSSHNGEWSARIDLAVGLTILRVSARARRQIVESRWLVIFRPQDDEAPPLIEAALAPDPNGFVVRGRITPTVGARARVVDTALQGPSEVSVAADGGFVVGPLLRPTGERTDLLVLLTNAQGQVIAATVLTIVPTTPLDADTTYGLTRNGRVSFGLPKDAAPSVVNGQPGSWVRARIVAGNYGVEARYEIKLKADGTPETVPDTNLPVYQLTPASFRPPSVKRVSISYDYVSPGGAAEQILIENDFAVADTGALLRSGAVIEPFRMPDEDRPALYLGFRRPGAATGFANRATTLYLGVAPIPYDSAAAGQVVAERASVIWEYWNGNRWNRLDTRDETHGLTRRGLVTFVGPPHFPARGDFGLAEALFWLRARWERGAYAHLPRLRRVLTNTTWASHTLTIQDESLGSSSGEPSQIFRTTRAPVLPGQRVEVREPELPSVGERAAIEAEEGQDAITTILGPGGRPAPIWVRWHETPDFYGSGPRSRHYTLDRLTGEIRFGDGRHGMSPPRGISNLRMAYYQTGGGLYGNRPVDTIIQLKSTVPYVDKVTNLEPSAGGSEPESMEAVMRRGPRVLRHRDRAVAIADFEDLAFEASPEVALVRGIPAAYSSDAGLVELIAVPRSADPKPIPSLELLGRVQSYIEERLAPTVDLWVRGPDWLKVTVRAEIVPESPEVATDVQTTVLARLADFLHPVTGGLDRTGWEFGRKPYRSDLLALVERTPGVNYVRRLQVDEQSDNQIVRADRFLVYSGDHEIVMSAASADLP